MILKENSSMGPSRGLSLVSKKNNTSALRSIQPKFFRGPNDDTPVKKKNENENRITVMKKQNINPVIIFAGDEDYQYKDSSSLIPIQKSIVKNLVQIYPRGLYNIGNTCYMNATLQCLFHLKQFSNILTNEINNWNSQKPLPLVANETSLAIKQMAKKQGGALNLGGLKKCMGRRRSIFMGSGQQDAQEYLTGLLQILNEELTRIKEKRKYKQLEGDPSKKSIKDISDQWWNYYRSIDNSIVCDAFQGQMISLTKCKKCSKVSVNFDNIWGLPITFHKNMSVYELLISNNKSQTTIQDYYCSQCRKLRTCSKVTELFRLPKHLVIQLKRFQFEKGQKKKRKQEVKIDKQLDLTKLLNENANKNQKCQYKLRGVVHHHGQAEYGHYYAQVYCEALKKWYILNDSSVDETSLSQVSKSAYLLFYEQVDS